MNLTGMLKEGSLADHRWYQDGLKGDGEITFDQAVEDVKSPNNVKPEAQDQWGYGDISPIFEEQDGAGVVERDLSQFDHGDAAPVVMFARDMMNAGAPAKDVDREVKANFTKEEMRQGLRGLRDLFALDGIIGRVALDARGHKSCKDAMKVAKNSPYKRSIKFVIGCSCGDAHMVPVADEAMEMVASSGNPADDFLADDRRHGVKEIPHCRSTMLTMYASIDDLDPTWVEDSMAVVENISGISSKDMKKLRIMDKKPIEKVKAAFNAADAAILRQQTAAYGEEVDASEFMMEAAENEIELNAEAMPQLEIDASIGDFIGEEVPDLLADLEDVDMTPDNGGTMFEGSDEIELEELRKPEASIDIEIGESEIDW